MKLKIALPVFAGILIALFLASRNFSTPKRVPYVPQPTGAVTATENTNQKIGRTTRIPLKISDGFSIGEFATDLIGARDLQFSPSSILLVSLTSSGRVVALPDNNLDGIADQNVQVLSGLNKPHGLAFYNGNLFVAEENRVVRYKFNENNLTAEFDKKLFDLPSGARHTTRSLLFDKNGNLFVSLGSTCDTCIEKGSFISTVLISDSDGKKPRIYSSGLRNAVFLALHPKSGEVWATEMGRDNLGDNIPPDEIVILRDGGNYGWPFCYGNKVTDTTQNTPTSNFCASSISPFYEIPAHSAPLGLAFINSLQFPDDWQNDLLISYHGSWNRSVPTGFKVVRINTNGTPKESDFITGFGQGRSAQGRPVDVIFDKYGSLYVSDDRANAVYKAIKSSQ